MKNLQKLRYQNLLSERRLQEIKLLTMIKKYHSKLSVREIIEIMDINEKRAYYILSKWDNRGWYDYGVTLDLGWLNEEKISKEINKYY